MYKCTVVFICKSRLYRTLAILWWLVLFWTNVLHTFLTSVIITFLANPSACIKKYWMHSELFEPFQNIHCKYLIARSECNDIVIFIYSHYPFNPNVKLSYTECFTLKPRPCPFIQILSWFYPDFILILSKFYPDKIKIKFG